MVKIAIPPTKNHQAMYVAVVDEGACISLTLMRVYCIVCDAVINELAMFPETQTGQQDTSLVEVRWKAAKTTAKCIFVLCCQVGYDKQFFMGIGTLISTLFI